MSYADNQDGTVTDTATGLMWQQATAPGKYTWHRALQYCENLTLAGQSDWRLPNMRELQSIVNYGRVNPSIDPIFGAESGWYRSSSTYVSSPNFAWNVNFNVGIVCYDNLGYSFFVRAVRGQALAGKGEA